MSLEPKAVADQLCRLLSFGIERSPELQRSLRALGKRGYRFQLVARLGDDSSSVIEVEVGARTAPLEAGPAAFRLDSDDVLFLESLGIDATRSARRRKR